MGFIYPKKFTYLNTFVIQLAQRCSDNGGSTVLGIVSSLVVLDISVWLIGLLGISVQPESAGFCSLSLMEC